jgi:beta-N-acetylhexosaminidase
MNRKAIIFGLKGTKLTVSEKNLLKKEKPWGIILFSRNIKNLYQLKILIDEIKIIVGDKNYPILIDEEGGRVSRLSKIIDLSIFSQSFFGNLFMKDKNNFSQYYKIYIDRLCETFKYLGININTVPVLDVKRSNAHSIIGDRSFSSNPNIVSKLGNICINFFNKNKISTVIKHIPGHGLALNDSHYKISYIDSKKNDLIKNDFKPFKMCKSHFAMTAHLVYNAYDSKYSATHSKIIINEVIRKHIGFNGLIITDDISMKALKYGLRENTTMALDAGCNLILHCNANINEMRKLIKIVPRIDQFIKKKTSQFYNFLG